MPHINRHQFLTTISKSLFKGKISDSQSEGINVLLDEFERLQWQDMRWLAVLLANVYHETYNYLKGIRMMRPFSELGGEVYLKSKPYYPYYGRDFCHTSWLRNYEKVKEFTGIDVVSHPELIAELPTAAKVIFHFMEHGLYTGKKLSDYFNADKEDWIWSRSIINGKRKGEPLPDKAELVAGYALKFFGALLIADEKENART